MNELAQKSLGFSKKTGEPWRDSGANDCKGYQRRLLYVSAFGAYHTAKSFWLLHDNRCFDDCGILARNLLERIINSSFAAKSPTHAVELIADDLTDKIRRLKLLNHPPHDTAELTASIANHEAQLQIFLGLIGKSEATRWTFCKRAEEAGI